MIYCDTSVLVSALVTTEPASEAAAQWLLSQTAGELAISDWVQTEFAGAIALKVRRGDLNERAKGRVLRAWSVIGNSFERLTVQPPHFDHAAQMMLEPGSRLRSGDALHLAISLAYGCEMATFDRDLRDAAGDFGIVAKGAAGPS